MTEDHKAKVKMILRYLAGSKACVLTLRPRVKLRPEMTSLDVVAYVDSDWAGCVRTMLSTSGVSVFFNGCLITSQTRTQQTIATSSGEAELYSIGLGTSECLFLKSLLIEMNITSRVNIRVFYRLVRREKHVDTLRRFEENPSCRTSFSFYARASSARCTSGKEGSRYFESCRCADKVCFT